MPDRGDEGRGFLGDRLRRTVIEVFQTSVVRPRSEIIDRENIGKTIRREKLQIGTRSFKE